MIPAPRNGEEPIPSTRSGNRSIEALRRENISLNQEIARLRRQRDFLIGLIAALAQAQADAVATTASSGSPED